MLREMQSVLSVRSFPCLYRWKISLVSLFPKETRIKDVAIVLVPKHEIPAAHKMRIPIRRSAQSNNTHFEPAGKLASCFGRFTRRPLCGRNDLSAKRVVAGISSVHAQRNTAGSLFMCDKRDFRKCRASRPSGFFWAERPLRWDYHSIINY